MIDGWIQKKPRRHVQDLNIVPILDMLTTVIFFLLMSTSFLEYTKHTIPPSSTATVSNSSHEEPRTPKLFLTSPTPTNYRLLLRWGGKNPGEKTESIEVGGDSKTVRALLLKASTQVVKEFAANNPSEKTIQIGLGTHLPYQSLISVMDGVRPLIPDIVLISYSEAEAVMNAVPQGGK